MNRAVRATTVALVALGALTACSHGSNPTSALPGASSAASSGPAASGQGKAPAVPAALPTDQLIANPCSALSDAQLTKLNMAAPGKRSQDSKGRTCTWNGATNDANSAYIIPLTPNKNGLSDTYDSRAQFAYFEPTTIDGYPAVYANPTDMRSQGDCPVYVGVTDVVAVNVTVLLYQGPHVTNPCEVTKAVATAMIEHLKGAA